jgi:hypothetical protein
MARLFLLAGQIQKIKSIAGRKKLLGLALPILSQLNAFYSLAQKLGNLSLKFASRAENIFEGPHVARGLRAAVWSRLVYHGILSNKEIHQKCDIS